MPHCGNCGECSLVEQIEFTRKILRLIWCRDSAAPDSQDGWSPGDPAHGQNEVTALLVQKLFGGDLLLVTPHGRAPRIFNCLPGGEMIDLTRERFWIVQEFSPISVCSRESVLGSPDAVRTRIAERHDRLWDSFVIMAREVSAESR